MTLYNMPSYLASFCTSIWSMYFEFCVGLFTMTTQIKNPTKSLNPNISYGKVILCYREFVCCSMNQSCGHTIHQNYERKKTVNNCHIDVEDQIPNGFPFTMNEQKQYIYMLLSFLWPWNSRRCWPKTSLQIKNQHKNNVFYQNFPWTSAWLLQMTCGNN